MEQQCDVCKEKLGSPHSCKVCGSRICVICDTCPPPPCSACAAKSSEEKVCEICKANKAVKELTCKSNKCTQGSETKLTCGTCTNQAKCQCGYAAKQKWSVKPLVQPPPKPVKVSQTFGNDEDIKRAVNSNTTSTSVIAECERETDKCPSCEQLISTVQAYSALNYLKMNGVVSPTKTDFDNAMTMRKSSKAHNIMGQSMIRKQTRNLIRQFLKEKGKSSAEWLTTEGWNEFCVFYKQEMLTACGHFKTMNEKEVKKLQEHVRLHKTEINEEEVRKQIEALEGKWKEEEKMREDVPHYFYSDWLTHPSNGCILSLMTTHLRTCKDNRQLAQKIVTTGLLKINDLEYDKEARQRVKEYTDSKKIDEEEAEKHGKSSKPKYTGVQDVKVTGADFDNDRLTLTILERKSEQKGETVKKTLVEKESVIIELKPGKPPLPEGEEHLELLNDAQRDKCREFHKKFGLKPGVTPINQTGKEGWAEFSVIVMGNNGRSFAVYTKIVGDKGETKEFLKDTYIEEHKLLHRKYKLTQVKHPDPIPLIDLYKPNGSVESKFLCPKGLLTVLYNQDGQQVASSFEEIKSLEVHEAEPWISRIFSDITSWPFTMGKQCPYCEELQGDYTLPERIFAFKSLGAPPEFVGKQMLARADILDPYLNEWLDAVLVRLKSGIEGLSKIEFKD